MTTTNMVTSGNAKIALGENGKENNKPATNNKKTENAQTILQKFNAAVTSGAKEVEAARIAEEQRIQKENEYYIPQFPTGF